MAITRINDAEAISTTTTLSVAAPPGLAAGDLLVSLFGMLADAAGAAAIEPAAWTPRGDVSSGTNLSSRLRTKVATASEPATYDWTLSRAVKNGGWVSAFRGVDTSNPVAAVQMVAGPAGTAQVTPAVDVPEGGWLIYGVLTRHAPGGVGSSQWSNGLETEPERAQVATNAGTEDITLAVYDSGGPMAAATGVTRTLTSSIAESNAVVFAIVLRPAPEPTYSTTVSDFEDVALGATTAAAVKMDYLSAPAGGGATIRNDGAFRGSQYLRLNTGTAAAVCMAERSTLLGSSSTGTVHLRGRFRVPTLPPDATGVRVLVITDGPGSFRAEVRLTNAGVLQLRDAAGVNHGSSTQTFTAGQWIDVGLAILAFSATTGQIQMAVFDGSTNIAQTVTSPATVNTLGAGGTNKAQFGAIRSGLTSFLVDLDDADATKSGAYPVLRSAASLRYGPWSGAVTATGFQAVYRLAGATTARLVVSTVADLTSPVYGPAGAPDSDGMVKLSVSGLTANTQYYYGVEANGVLLAVGRGEVRTFPTPGAPASYSFAFGSCQFTVPSDSTFAAVRNRVGPHGRALFFPHMGDLHYRDWAAGTTAAQVLDQHMVSLGSASMAPFLSQIPMPYAWDNHDWGGDQSDRTAAAGNVVAAVYRQTFPHYNLPASNGRGCYHSWVAGRVRYIQLDVRSYRDPQANPDGSAKTMLGAEQLAWLKAELLRPEPVKIICGNVYWRYDNPSSGRWGSYGYEFNAINDWIAANRPSIGGIYVIFGDRHALCADNGTATGTAGIPQAGGAPIQQGSIASGETWSAGYYHNAPSVIQGFGWMDVTDTGDKITLDYKGITSLDGVVRVQMTTEFQVASGGPVIGFPVF